MDEIINKVASSDLQVFDLEEYYPSGIRTQIDISEWLLEGYILKEKNFRETLKFHDWKQYENHFVAIYCATDAIIPTWASILVAVYLSPFAKKVVAGTLYDLETALYFEIIPTIDYSKFQDKSVILKVVQKNQFHKALTSWQFKNCNLLPKALCMVKLVRLFRYSRKINRLI